jgi:hypothetical protein
MSPETEALAIELLQSISGKIDEIKEGLEQMNQCLDRIERPMAEINQCLDHIELRLDRIGRRLTAGEGADTYPAPEV